MIANYHTHTARCHHAVGTEEEYVREAIDRGLKILGFTDHTPQWFPGDYYSHMRMRPEELPDYVNTVNRLKETYKKDIEIHLGMEVEYYPAIFPELVSHLKDSGIEYIILGQHWCKNEMGEPYNGNVTSDPARLVQYCDQVIEAMETGLFTYFAHPDLLHFVGDEALYDTQFLRICQASRETNTPLEINLLGMRDNRWYPRDRFFPLAAEAGCSVILGCDTHKPQDITDPDSEAKAIKLVEQYGLNLLTTIPLKSF